MGVVFFSQEKFARLLERGPEKSSYRTPVVTHSVMRQFLALASVLRLAVAS